MRCSKCNLFCTAESEKRNNEYIAVSNCCKAQIVYVQHHNVFPPADIIKDSKIQKLESEKKELLELLKDVLILYRETVKSEWNYDIFKAGYDPEIEPALQCLKNNGIEIK